MRKHYLRNTAAKLVAKLGNFTDDKTVTSRYSFRIKCDCNPYRYNHSCGKALRWFKTFRLCRSKCACLPRFCFFPLSLLPCSPASVYAAKNANLAIQQTTVPIVTTSYYMSTSDTGPAFQLGCTTRRNGQQGIVVLNFGSPRNLGTQVAPIFGTRLLFGSSSYLTLADITSVVKTFAQGYYGIALCSNPPSNPVPPKLTIAIGTTNSKVYIGDDPSKPYVDNPALTNQHGVAWVGMVQDVNSYLRTAGYTPYLRAAGGYDAERGSGWSSYTPTLAWAQGFSSDPLKVF